MDDVIACPACSTSATPAAQIGAVAVCGACGASLHVGEDGVRRATAADTTNLSAQDLQTLRRARGRPARPER